MARTYKYSIVIAPANATDKTVTWSIIDAQNDPETTLTGRALIDTDGNVTPTQIGTIKVVATANDGSGIQATKVVTIVSTPILVETIAFESDNPEENLDIIYLDSEV